MDYFCSVSSSTFIINFMAIIIVIGAFPVVLSYILIWIPGEALLSASPSASVASPSTLARLHACISPSRTTCIMVPFSLSTEVEAVFHFMGCEICYYNHITLYIVCNIKRKRIIQQNGSKRTLLNFLNSAGFQPGSLFCIPCFLQRQPELITSECTPWNDGWALATGLSGEGAGPYGSGIWKLIAEDRAKGGE